MEHLYNNITMRFTGMTRLSAAVVLISFIMKNTVSEPGLPDNMELLLTQKAGYDFFIHEPYEDWNSAYPATGQEIIIPILFPDNKHTHNFLCETKISVRYRLNFLQYFEVVAGVNFHNLFGRINPDFKNKNYTMNIGGLWIHPAELIIKNINISKFESRLHIGAFPVKYNPDARLYGEYLFRYGIYPIRINDYGMDNENILLGKYVAKYQYLEENPAISDVQPYSNHQYSDTVGFTIEGIKWEISFLGQSINNHFSLYFDDQYRLTKQYYFTWIIGYQLHEIFGISAGWQYLGGNAISIPHSRSNEDKPETKLIFHNYSLKANKLMCRGFLNIQNISGIRNYFENPNDFKIFFEGAILGTKNHSFYYEKRVDRIAFTSGLYLPSLGLLDVFCIQGEYFKNAMIFDPPYSSNNPFQYGLFIKKSIGNMFQIICEAARQQNADYAFGRLIKRWNCSLKILLHI